jgi:Uma2 family endonuclease
MKTYPEKFARLPGGGEPAWKIAYLFPSQGNWYESEYLALNTNLPVELSQGRLEVLPMPTTPHQLLTAYLYGLLLAFAAGRDLGTVLFSGTRVRLWPGEIREPDVVFMLKEHADRVRIKFWKGADLVMEVVSGGAKDRKRDLKDKRQEYARAGIPEYWIVDPRDETITVLRLEGKKYAVHGEYPQGATASSHLLPGFSVDVTTAFAQRLPSASAKQPRKPRRPKQP